jgi:hypothetical protein
MPDRYWVGGTAAWDGTAGTKWAATSGGAGGESVPTIADDVFFDAASSGTCTIAAGNTGAKSINCTGFTGGIAGSASITVAGSITLDAGQTYTHTGTVTITGTGTLTTAGKTFSGVTVNGSGITVTLGDALTLVALGTITTETGSFVTGNYSVTCGALVSGGTGTKSFDLGSSTITLNNTSGGRVVDFRTSTNLTFSAGTSQINATGVNSIIDSPNGATFHNVSFIATSTGARTIIGANTFNNLTLNASAIGLSQLSIGANQTVNGTFTCAGSSALNRGFVRSDVIGTTRTITAAVISADDCDFRDITIAGAAAPISPTRAGDCGGNSGITFPAAKTVYRVGTSGVWRGSSSWALTSGGSGSNDNFPLAQDTAVIDENTALTGTLTNAISYNVGSLNCSTRTTALTLAYSGIHIRYGDYILGSGVTTSGTTTQTFSGRGTQTFTSAGKTITFGITIDKPAGAFELGDALVSSSSITHTRGTLDAKNYNVTCTEFLSSNTNTRTLTMGSGLWTLSGTGSTVWFTSTTTGLTFNKDTANILFSGTSTSSRNFSGGGLTYNKLTIGGATGTSTTNIVGTNTFTELASTKTVAHTITFTTNQTIGTWSVTGTSGNVVTVNSNIAGTRRTINLTNKSYNIDYLDVQDIGITDPDKFFVGSNSTDSGNNLNVIFESATARYWVGGTAAWDGTAGSKWSLFSGADGGASIPTTADDVFFDAASSGTCTIAAGNTGAKSINCTGFTGTITGSGAGSAITVAGSITLDAGQTYTHTGFVTITGTGTLTTAGKTFSGVIVDAAGNTVTLGDALNVAARGVFITRGTFDTDNYNVTAGGLTSNTSGTTRAINLNASTVALSISVNFANVAGLTFNAGTSQINLSSATSQLVGAGQTFHNASFTSTAVGIRTLAGANTFNNLTLNASATGLSQLALSDDQTVNGTFTCAGDGPGQRGFVRSNIIGTTRTITAAAVSADDCDFRDITISGAAAPISPTRAGDCGGNSGITFPAAKTVYRVGTATAWYSVSSVWALTSGGAGGFFNFPLAQDTAVIDDNTALTGTLALAVYNIGSLDASARTTGITLDHNAAAIRYGDYTLGSGVTVSGTSNQTFSGRGTQTFTSAGKTITFPITVDKPAGAFELGDALVSSSSITHTRGTLDAKNYNVTCTTFSSGNTNTRTLTMGSGLWTLSGGNNATVWNTLPTTNLTFNKDTANILLSSDTTGLRDFSGGSLLFNKLTIGAATGANALVRMRDNTTFTEIASIKAVAFTLQFFANHTIGTWSVTGTSGNVVTLNSNIAGTRRTITLTNATSGIDYLDVKDIGITDPNKFYVGANSTDSGNNLNVIFTAAPSATGTGNFILLFV